MDQLPGHRSPARLTHKTIPHSPFLTCAQAIRVSCLYWGNHPDVNSGTGVGRIREWGREGGGQGF